MTTNDYMLTDGWVYYRIFLRARIQRPCRVRMMKHVRKLETETCAYYAYLCKIWYSSL